MSSTPSSPNRSLSSAGLLVAVGLLALLAAGPLPAEGGAPAAEPPAPPLSFDLKDQFDREHTQAMCAGRIAIVVIADREGSKFSGPWSEAVSRGLDAAAPATEWVPVATLPAVPGFMRGFIRGKFPQKKEQWTLLDWGGSLARAYGLEGKRCHVLVFGPDGRLCHRSGGREVDAAAVTAVVAAVAAAGSGGSPR